jgi:hypothetical protein
MTRSSAAPAGQPIGCRFGQRKASSSRLSIPGSIAIDRPRPKPTDLLLLLFPFAPGEYAHVAGWTAIEWTRPKRRVQYWTLGLPAATVPSVVAASFPPRSHAKLGLNFRSAVWTGRRARFETDASTMRVRRVQIHEHPQKMGLVIPSVGLECKTHFCVHHEFVSVHARPPFPSLGPAATSPLF